MAQWRRTQLLVQAHSLVREDPLEEGMAAHSIILAGRIPMDRGAWRAAVQRATKNRTQLKQLSKQKGMKKLKVTKGKDIVNYPI